jgi:hypothetical protein
MGDGVGALRRPLFHGIGSLLALDELIPATDRISTQSAPAEGADFSTDVMSWNAAGRFRCWGYRNIACYGPRTDGWTEVNLPLDSVRPAEDFGFR